MFSRNTGTLWSVAVGAAISSEALSTAYRIVPRADNLQPAEAASASFRLYVNLTQVGTGTGAITWQTSPDGTTWTDLPITGLATSAAGTDYAEQEIHPMSWVRVRATPGGGSTIWGLVTLGSNIPFTLATA